VHLERGRAFPEDPPPSDVVVWACGAWLPQLFPAHVNLQIARRDVFFFGGGADWQGTPGFCDYDGPFYGHGEIGGLGVKIAPDTSGGEIDPDSLERLPLASLADAAREYAARRFPALAEAPIVGSRVCQYELTGDTHFLFAPHPEREGWWLLGGGSGHGFKHGPALAEYVADCVEGRRAPEPFHALGERTGHAGLRTAVHG
jgi:glycine/D-amino acid oxidase-like deaminating enzyme